MTDIIEELFNISPPDITAGMPIYKICDSLKRLMQALILSTRPHVRIKAFIELKYQVVIEQAVDNPVLNGRNSNISTLLVAQDFMIISTVHVSAIINCNAKLNEVIF